MGIYDKPKTWFDTLKWEDIFHDKQSFIDKMNDLESSVNNKLEPLEELYDILYLKYHSSYTRYTSELPFIMSIKREMMISWPIYIQQKSLMDDMMEMEIEEIQRQAKSISNLVDRPTVNLPDNPSEEPIKKLSTQQQTLFNVGNKLNAVRDKYYSINHDFLQNIYDRLDIYFRVIQRDDTFILYKQED